MPTNIEERLPRSAIRHRPITDATHVQVQTPRASRKSKPYAPDDLAFPDGSTRNQMSAPKAAHLWLVYLVLGMLCACVLLWLGQLLWNYGTMVSDDLHYGRPRTTNVDHFVGHGNMPSHFTALNLNGQIYIIEIPGSDPSNSHLLVGPHLYGQGSDLAPVTISFVGDAHHPDLLITVSNIQVRFRNTGNDYTPEP